MKKINSTSQFLKDQGFTGDLGIILGTGLGNLIDEVAVEKEILYEDIPAFPVSTVESHHGKLIKGKIGGKTALILQGRFHFYEGYSMQEITFPIRVLHALGI
jgi:purine-nucleoside phosphorylase